MAEYTDFLRDVSYYLSCNLYVPRLRETDCEYFFTLLSDSSLCIRITTSSASLSSQILERFAAILLYTKETFQKLADYV